MKKQQEIRKTSTESVGEVKEEIIKMVNQIENEKYIKMIYGFVKRLHKE